MKKDNLIYIAGHEGLVGSAIMGNLKLKGYKNLICRSRSELNLCDQISVDRFFQKEKPEFVFIAAAKVGGIKANMNYPADFIYENLVIQSNLIHFSYKYDVKKLLFFGSGCSYPRQCLQPIKEEYLLAGYLEPTNEPYAVAKISGIKMCEAYNCQYGTNFICAIPATIYGPNDNFDLDNSHVIPALIRKFHEAKMKGLPSVTIWGSGNSRREFIYVDDAADASVFLMLNYNELKPINIGVEKDISIKELAFTIKKIVGYVGKVDFDTSKPDGAAFRKLEISKLSNIGWHAKIKLKPGIAKTYDWYKSR